MTELAPYTVLTTLSAAIVATTGLRSVEELAEDRTTPSPLLHRSFRLDPGDMDFEGKGRPGDVQLVRETVTIVLTHDSDPGQKLGSYQLASADLVGLLRAVLTRSEFSGLGQPKPVRVRRRRVGHQLEQAVTITASYHFTLPAAE